MKRGLGLGKMGRVASLYFENVCIGYFYAECGVSVIKRPIKSVDGTGKYYTMVFVRDTLSPDIFEFVGIEE